MRAVPGPGTRRGDSTPAAGADLPSGGVGPDATDLRLIARLRAALPLISRPFVAVGADVGLTEDAVIERLRRLLAQGVLTHFGPLLRADAAALRSEFDRVLLESVVSGLPVLPRPFEALGAMLGVSEATVRERLAALIDTGLIVCIGAVANPDRTGQIAGAAGDQAPG